MIEGIELHRHPRARRLRLAVDPTSGRVRLTVPPRMAVARALAWAAAHEGWIAAQQERLPQARPFAPGECFPFGDAELTIKWCESASWRVVRDGDVVSVGGPLAAVNGRIASWLKREALAALSADTAHFAALAGVKIARVSIGDPRGRWGSCTGAGDVRYSWRLILAPDFVRRATVAHEVAHRIHMNHGPEFHALVARLLGDDPKRATSWLRRHGASLHWFGRAS